MSDSHTITYNSKELKEYIEMTAIRPSGKRRKPIFIWGPPGIGKSEVVEQVAHENDAIVIDLRMALLDPTDLRGIGYFNPEKGLMDWAPPVDLPSPAEAEKHKLIILFLDEMNSAPPAVQAAAYQLVLNRRIGEYHLPDNVAIVAAGNRDTDKGVTYRMPKPLANRFLHFEMRADLDTWIEWAVANRKNSNVVSFLKANPSVFHRFDPSSADKTFPTPRSWTYLADLMDENPDLSENHIINLVSASVGQGPASSFRGHLMYAAKMPHPDDIIDGKANKLGVDEMSAQWSMSINLLYKLNDHLVQMTSGMTESSAEYNDALRSWHDKVDNVVAFIMDKDNATAELAILTLRTAVKVNNLPIKVQMSKNFTAFVQKYGKYLQDKK